MIHATLVGFRCLCNVKDKSHLHCGRVRGRPGIRWRGAAIRKVAPAADSYGIRVGESVDGREPVLIRTYQSRKSQGVQFSLTRKVTPSLVPRELSGCRCTVKFQKTHHQDPTLCCLPQAGHMMQRIFLLSL